MTREQDTITFTINGQRVTAAPGSKLLDAAREHGFEIPTLCHNHQVSRYGSCRLCMVEAARRGRTRVVASCDFDVAEGLEVKTDTQEVNRIRRLVLELLWARCPEADEVVKLARRYGVAEPRFPLDDDKGKCILCGQCVRACREVVGATALGFHNRGGERSMGTPFELPSRCCIGCGTCAYICPTGHIVMEEYDGVRKIWDTEFDMQACDVCGRYFAPRAQLEWISKLSKMPVEHFTVCKNCK